VIEKKIITHKKYSLIIIIFFLTKLLILRSFQDISINDIKIFGNKNITKQDILDNSSLKVSSRLILIKTKLIEKELKKNLSLRNISINRQLFPFGIKILIQSREPIAYAEKKYGNKIIKGFIDREGIFIPKQFTKFDEKLIFTIKVFGWDKKYVGIISKILKAYENKKGLETIEINQKGFLSVEDKKLKKILLGFNHSNIDAQLNQIFDIKNQIDKKEILKKIEILDLTDINSPKIKVFKP